MPRSPWCLQVPAACRVVNRTAWHRWDVTTSPPLHHRTFLVGLYGSTCPLLAEGMKLSGAGARGSLSVCCIHRNLLPGQCTFPWTPTLGTASLAFYTEHLPSPWGLGGTVQCIFCWSMELPKKPLSNGVEMQFKGACEV